MLKLNHDAVNMLSTKKFSSGHKLSLNCKLSKYPLKCMYMVVFHACISASNACLVVSEARRGYPLELELKALEATMCVLSLLEK